MVKIIKLKRKKGVEEEFEVRDLREKFFMVDDAYLNGWAKKCGVYASAAYFVLCRHVGRDQSCFPSVALIAEKMGISVRQVSYALKVLEAHNIIKVERSAGERNKYWLTNKSEWHDAVIGERWWGPGRPSHAPKGLRAIPGGPAKQLRRNREAL
jgi:DNA-binding transcriptional ArsR family regulator